MNSEIKNALECVNQTYQCSRHFYGYEEIIAYWENKDSFTWDNLCEFASMKVRGYVTLRKYTLMLLVYLLETKKYNNAYKEKLNADLPMLKACLDDYNSNYREIIDKNYDELVFLVNNKRPGIKVQRISKINSVFRNLFIEFLETNNNGFQRNPDLIYNFPNSIGDKEIRSYKDINSTTFWKQVHFYQNYFSNDELLKQVAIKGVICFYRWLITRFSDYDFFSGSSSLSAELISNNTLVKYINRNAYFTTYTKTEDLGDRPLICFITRNMDKYSTNIKKVDHFVLDTKILDTSLYRRLVNKYIQNATVASLSSYCNSTRYIINGLHFIETIKTQTDYPNPSTHIFNTNEAVIIRNYFKKDNDQTRLETLNRRIASIRQFFKWCEKTKNLFFDETFFDYFSQYEAPNINRGDAIPDDDLRKITDAFDDACKTDRSYFVYYAIFLVLLETEFRVSQICSLKISSLQASIKKDQFYVVSNTKTSNGRKLSQPITLSTKRILDTAIECTQELRDIAHTTDLSERIFLKQSHTGVVVPIDYRMFRVELQKICEQAGVRNYTSQNLRDTHMTKAFEFILKSGKSDLELGLLSKHKHIDTTKNHYIEMELTKMLESTYKVILGNRDINQQANLLPELPEDLKGKDSLVENGCGHCTSAMCAVQGSIPCLVCQHFVTTASHKQYFIKMIEMINRKIDSATIPHEIEDLNLIKKLYVNWLREICIYEETKNEEFSDC